MTKEEYLELGKSLGFNVSINDTPPPISSGNTIFRILDYDQYYNLLSKSDLDGKITVADETTWNIQNVAMYCWRTYLGVYYGPNHANIDKGTLDLLQNNKNDTNRTFLTLENYYWMATAAGGILNQGNQDIDSEYHSAYGYYVIDRYRYTWNKKNYFEETKYWAVYNDEIDPTRPCYRPTINFLETS